MTAPRPLLPSRDAEKLSRICNLFSSDHAGERAAAARKADELIRRFRLSWPEIIARALGAADARDADDLPPAQHDIAGRAGWVKRRANRLTVSSLRFLDDLIARPRPLTERQARWLTNLEQQVRRGRR
jgi:hypothetical protein